MESEALVAIGAFHVVTALLCAVLPGPVVDGYVLDRTTSKPLKYKLNALLTLVVESAAYVALAQQGVIDGAFLSRHFWPCVVAANVFGLAIVAGFYLRGILYPQTREWEYVTPTVGAPVVSSKKNEAKVDHGFLYNVYVGFQFNPRWGLFDAKMYLYLFGAVLLQLNIISAVYEQKEILGHVTTPMTVAASLLTFFVVEYTYHEHVHLYTYDLFAEKIGFKLAWGCLVFYPFFYALPIRALVTMHAQAPVWVAPAAIFLFFLGWVLSRGANNQKYYFRTSPQSKYLFGLVTQKTIPNSRILCSGWWGLSRHINYAGEIFMGMGVALPAGYALITILPWLYPLYYVGLLLPREREDDRICETKYGEAWRQYRKQVPYRVFPFIY